MQEIKIKWDGETFKVKEDQVFDIASQLEEFLDFRTLHLMAHRPSFTKLSRALAVIINTCGGDVSPKDIHKEMMKEVKALNPEDLQTGLQGSSLMAATAVEIVLEILMDGAPEPDEEKKDSGKK